MSNFNRNEPLFAELTAEQAVTIRGGFFKRLKQKTNKFGRVLRPFFPIGKPIIEPVAGRSTNSLIAKPIGKTIDPPEP